MLSLSPAKLLVVLVVALLVLGPEKLPQVARQLGAFWADLRKWRERLESEVRSSFPDLPPTHEVVQAVRSPLSFLDRLADAHTSSTSNGTTAEGSTDPVANGPPTAGDEQAVVPERNGGRDGDAARDGRGGEEPDEGTEKSRESDVGSVGSAAHALPAGNVERLGPARGSPLGAAWRPPVRAGEDGEWTGDDPSMN